VGLRQGEQAQFTLDESAEYVRFCAVPAPTDRVDRERVIRRIVALAHQIPNARIGAALGSCDSHDGARHEVTAQVPHDAVFVTFGIILTGQGRIELRHAELASGS
jgi:hypothetical protein